jgi:PAS domain S-box-containing protein
MIEHSIDLICSLDANGKLTAANPACKVILGHTEDILVGMNLRSMLANEDIDFFNQSLSLAMSGNTETKFESRIRQKDGNLVDVLWSIHWVESEQAFFCVGHNITARKEVERLKQQFMAMISHDLRTPLTTIGNYLEMLSTGIFGQLTEKGLHLLKVAERNASRMLTLTNDLLDLERAEFGGLKLSCSEQKLSDLIDVSVKSISSLAAEHQINIDVQPLDLLVSADANRIEQVLVNLLNNAIKFSPAQSIIKISVHNENEMAIVCITDEGRGIPEHLKESIFERFKQVEISDAIDKGGSGLGLAICKTIVELHGGKINVENNTTKGSTFSFSLPLAKKEQVKVAASYQ